MFPATGEPLDLQEHLSQLKTLYKNIKSDKLIGENTSGIKTFFELLSGVSLAKQNAKENPYYPKESYDEFISSMIDKKKQKIERVLDLR